MEDPCKDKKPYIPATAAASESHDTLPPLEEITEECLVQIEPLVWAPGMKLDKAFKAMVANDNYIHVDKFVLGPEVGVDHIKIKTNTEGVSVCVNIRRGYHTDDLFVDVENKIEAYKFIAKLFKALQARQLTRRRFLQKQQINK